MFDGKQNSSTVFGYSISKIKSSSSVIYQRDRVNSTDLSGRRTWKLTIFSLHYFTKKKYVFTNQVDLSGRVVTKTLEFLIVFRHARDMPVRNPWNKIHALQNSYILQTLLFFLQYGLLYWICFIREILWNKNMAIR